MKGKTQMGEPLMPPAGFTPPGGAPMISGPMGPQSQGTPSAGNHAIPAMVPQAPARQAQGGGKGPLLAGIAVVGLLSVRRNRVRGPAQADAATNLQLDLIQERLRRWPSASTPVANDTPAPNDSSGLAPLTPGPAVPQPHGGPTPAAHHDGGTTPHPSGSTSPTPGPVPAPAPRRPRPIPPECAQARGLQNHPALKEPARQGYSGSLQHRARGMLEQGRQALGVRRARRRLAKGTRRRASARRRSARPRRRTPARSSPSVPRAVSMRGPRTK